VVVAALALIAGGWLTGFHPVDNTPRRAATVAPGSDSSRDLQVTLAPRTNTGDLIDLRTSEDKTPTGKVPGGLLALAIVPVATRRRHRFVPWGTTSQHVVDSRTRATRGPPLAIR
jgi:hypothetical protein